MSVRITGGIHRGRRLRPTRSAGLRPTTERVREAIFSILGQEAVEGARVLDLYAGTGVLAMEALSRGAVWADLVEVSAKQVSKIKENLLELSLQGQARVHRARVERALETLPKGYDLVFADPPYEMNTWDSLMGRLGDGGLVQEDGEVVVEHRHGTTLAEQYGSLVQRLSRRYGDTVISIYGAGAMNA